MKTIHKSQVRRLSSTLLLALTGAALCAMALPVQAQTLLHRWSFTTDGADSVGGVACTPLGGASIAGGFLNLPGGGTRANCGQINGITSTLNTNASITVEAWLTVNVVNNWSKAWMFGAPNADAMPRSYIDFTPRAGAGGNVPSMSIDTTTTEEVNTRSGTNPALWEAGLQYHAVCVYDAASDTMSMYLNGARVDSAPMGGRTISAMNSTEAYIGAAVFFGDADLNGSFAEMRVYGGAVGGLQIAVNTQTGADVIDTAIALNSLTLNVNSLNVTIGDLQDTSITYNTVTYGSITVPSSTEVTYSVNPAGVVQVSSNGRISAIAPGVATVTATRGDKSSSAVITVADVQLALQHRYSFKDEDGMVAVDAVNPAGNGTLMGAAMIMNNEVVLPGGTFSSDPSAAYVDLPNGLVSDLNSITIEAWVTDNQGQGWARIYDFGNSVGGENTATGGEGQSYMMMAARNGAGDFLSEITLTGSATPANQIQSWVGHPLPVGTKVHVAYSIDALAQVARLYVNGVQVDMDTNVTVRPKNMGVTVNNWLGRAQFNDPMFNGAIDEFRIWNRALSVTHLAASIGLGPDFVLSNPTLQALTVQVPSTSMVGGTTQQATALANFAQTNGVPVNGAVTAWISSNTDVLTVDNTGLITAVGPGTATVSATVDGVTDASDPITIAVIQPTISQQPVSLNRYVGAPAIFTVTAGGGQLTYQWKKGGVNIAGATTSSFILPSVSMADNATAYSVGVTNAAGGVLSSAATLTVLPLPGGYPGMVMGDVPWSYWRLGESFGATTAADTFAGLNGTYVGFVGLGMPGVLADDTAADFQNSGWNAAAEPTTYVEVPHSAALNPETAFSVEFWAKPYSIPTDLFSPLSSLDTTANRSGYLFYMSGTAWEFRLGNTNGYIATVSGGTPSLDWQHVVGVFDGTVAYMYVNGVRYGPITPTGYYTPNPTAPFRIGGPTGFTRAWYGQVDEVAVYQKALSSTEVVNHYQMAIYGTTTPPFLLSDFTAHVTNYPTATRNFRIAAAGSPPLVYEWSVNGTPVGGATDSTFSLVNLTSADNNKTIRVKVSNAVGFTNSVTSTLHIITTPLLAHRWSFTSDGADSVGGATCTPLGGASISGGSLLLPGGGTRANCGTIHDIVSTLNANESITVEGWLTVNAVNNWSKAWMFGAPSDDATLRSFIDFTPRAGADGNVPSMSINTTTTAVEANTRGGANPALWVGGRQYHAVTTYDANNDTMSMYLDGVLVDSASMGGRTISAMQSTEAYIGAAVFFGDADLNGSVTEMRIYPGVLPPYQVLGNYRSGPDVVAPAVVIGFAPAGGNDLTLTWVTGTLQSAPTVTGPWANVPNATSPYTLSTTEPQLYYRVVVP